MTKQEMAVHSAITRALDEAGVKPEVLRGMCLEVGLEKFRDEVSGSAAGRIDHYCAHCGITHCFPVEPSGEWRCSKK